MAPSDTETGTHLEFRLTDPEEYPTDLADRLGITQSTFSQHVRTAQCKIISTLYEEHLLDTAEAREDRRLGS